MEFWDDVDVDDHQKDLQQVSSQDLELLSNQDNDQVHVHDYDRDMDHEMGQNFGQKLTQDDGNNKDQIEASFGEKRKRISPSLQDVNIRMGRFEESFLHLATKKKKIHCVADLLLLKGIDVNIKDINQQTPLHYLVEEQLDETSLKILVKLLSNGAQVAFEEDGTERGRGRAPPLFTALERYDEDSFRETRREFVIKLIEAGSSLGPSVESKGNTPLHVFCEKSEIFDDQVFLKFLEHGAHINAKNNEGKTPFHLYFEYNGADTSFERLKEVMQLFESKGSVLRDTDFKGRSVLVSALNRISGEIISLINLKHSCDVNAVDGRGYNALCLAFDLLKDKKYLNLVIKLLLVDGVEVSVKATDGETALSLAIKCEASETVVDMLLIQGVGVEAKDIELSLDHKREDLVGLFLIHRDMFLENHLMETLSVLIITITSHYKKTGFPLIKKLVDLDALALLRILIRGQAYEFVDCILSSNYEVDLFSQEMVSLLVDPITLALHLQEYGVIEELVLKGFVNVSGTNFNGVTLKPGFSSALKLLSSSGYLFLNTFWPPFDKDFDESTLETEMRELRKWLKSRDDALDFNKGLLVDMS